MATWISKTSGDASGVSGSLGGSWATEPIVAASTITLDDPFVYISGTGTISTINGGMKGKIYHLISQDGFSTDTNGNIASAEITTAGEALYLIYDGEQFISATRRGTSDDWINVKDFGATGVYAQDALPYFLAAFIAAGSRGRKIVVPAGSYRFSAPLVLSLETLGFLWRNIIVMGEGPGTAGREITVIYTDGFDAFQIHKEAYNQWNVKFYDIAFHDLREGEVSGRDGVSGTVAFVGGTVTAPGPATVVGTGTAFTQEHVGMRFRNARDARDYMITAVDEGTQTLTLNKGIQEVAGSGLLYEIFPDSAAVHIIHDPSASSNYSIGNIFHNVGVENFAAAVHFEAINMPTLNHGFMGKTTLNQFHTFQTKYALRITGATMNQAVISDSFFHAGGAIYIERARTGTTYAPSGRFKLNDNHQQGSEPSIIVLEDGCSGEFSFQNHNSEATGIGGADALLTQFGTPGAMPELIFYGTCRLPGATETPPRIGACVVSAFTDDPITIVPQGTVIRTPLTVRVVPPTPTAGVYTTASRLFWFGVPKSLAFGAPARVTPQPIAGWRVGSTAVGGYRKQNFPYLYNADQDSQVVTYFTNAAIPNMDSKTVFTVAQSLSVLGSGTRFLNSSVTIDATAIPFSTGYSEMPWADGEYTIVLGVSLLSGEAINAMTVQFFRSTGTLTPISCGYGSWNYDSRVINMLIPEGHTEEFQTTQATGGSFNLRVMGTNATNHGFAFRLTVSVNDGLLGSGQWIFHGTSAGTKTQTTIYSSPGAGITFTASGPASSDLGILNVNNTTGSTVTIRARVEYL
jgi:hypothetical protein